MKINKILFLFLFFAGCGYIPRQIKEFSSEQYINLTSYYNTFYNSLELYESAINDIEVLKHKSIIDNKPFKLSQINSTTKEKLQKTIEKTSKFLSNYPTSKYIPDALILIGNSTFYSNELIKTQKKCNEIFERYPNTKYSDLALLLQLKIYVEEKNESKIKNFVEKILSIETVDSEFYFDEVVFLIRNYYFESKDYVNAEKYLSLLAEKINRSETKSYCYYLIGLCYENMNDIEKAKVNYDLATVEADDYAQKIKYLISNFKTEKNYKIAIDKLNELTENEINKDYYPEINYEIGNIFYKNKIYTKAIDKFVFVDTNYAQSKDAVYSRYFIGEILYFVENKPDSALKYYERAKSGITEENSLFKEINSKHYFLSNYTSYKNEVKIIQSEIFTIDTIKKDTLSDSLKYIYSTKKDSLFILENKKYLELAGFFHLNQNLIDSAIIYYDKSFKNLKDSVSRAQIIFSLADIYSKSNKSKSDSLYNEIIKNFGTTIYVNKSREFLNLPKIVKVNEAEKLFQKSEDLRKQNKIDSALIVLNKIKNNYPTDDFAIKSLLVIAEINSKNLKKNDEALKIYKLVVEKYPTTIYSKYANKFISNVDTLKNIDTIKVANDSLKINNLKNQKTLEE